MRRRVSRRRLVVAAVLVVLAILPNVVHVYGADHQLRWKDEPMHEPRPVVRVMFLDRDWFFLDASADRAMRVGVWWYWYGPPVVGPRTGRRAHRRARVPADPSVVRAG
jgi:hypothetical protein